MLQTARTVRIHLFGRPHLSEDDVPLKFKAPARALSLLTYLFVHGSAPLSRDAVAFALWPDDMESDARANLRRHLFYLTNDVLPPPAPHTPWIVADKRTIGWNAEAAAWCDLREFERLSAAGDASEAVALYRGDLLEGFEDEWLEAPRERFRELQVRLLLDLIAGSRAAKAHAAGIGYARQLLAIDPWREDGIRALIELRNANGDRAGALATYRDFVKRLEAEMGVAPMPETTRVYERVATITAPSAPLESGDAGGDAGAGDGQPPSEAESADGAFVPSPFWRAPQSISNAEAVRPCPSFTGREAELALLEAALWERTGHAAIHGLGGVGKSALAREYARRNRDRYAAVWWLNAETEAGIVDGLVRLGSEFVPGLAKIEDRRSAAEQVTANVLSGLTKPVLLVFDNLDDERLLRTWSPRSVAQILVTSRHAVLGGEIVRAPPAGLAAGGNGSLSAARDRARRHQRFRGAAACRGAGIFAARAGSCRRLSQGHRQRQCCALSRTNQRLSRSHAARRRLRPRRLRDVPRSHRPRRRRSARRRRAARPGKPVSRPMRCPKNSSVKSADAMRRSSRRFRRPKNRSGICGPRRSMRSG